jgi:class 3 adenylate cyclase
MGRDGEHTSLYGDRRRFGRRYRDHRAAKKPVSTLRCPACGHENRAGAKFCDECGAAVQGTATGAHHRTGAATPAAREPRTYTPRHLAEKILSSRAALEGERKQVTVLFADVKGSMELAESLDPEDWHRVLDRFFQLLAEGVHRFEGTVNQYTGDGIMALFGAPIAHEDHGQRACYAALHLRDTLRAYADELRRTQGLNLSTRIRINSGEVTASPPPGREPGVRRLPVGSS